MFHFIVDAISDMATLSNSMELIRMSLLLLHFIFSTGGVMLLGIGIYILANTKFATGLTNLISDELLDGKYNKDLGGVVLTAAIVMIISTVCGCWGKTESIEKLSIL